MHEEREMYEVGVLLENFWCKTVFRSQFVLLLFLRGLISSVLPSITKLSFVERKSLLKKHVLIIYPNCSYTFLKRTFCCEGDLVEKTQSSY